ncbi:uncharacterized protein BX663DRAFT_444199, partial [Cokeromyces recurvatus]|uniref:uncharacterized protein n=1 Tax=Cokeromyces recurvatus TaxID=90255 RepID=UPI00221F640B
DDWMTGTPIRAPLPTSVYPIAALLTISAGFLTAGLFIIQGNKTPLLQQLKTAALASLLLGFGAIFASNAAGVYL